MEKSATNEVSITKITIKKENDDIKEFAETAMNELLGWYGYENPRDEAKNTRSCRSHSGSNSSGPESPKFTEGCGWCGKPVGENSGLTSAAATFCSELCFSQSRRASFKKNKTCDWCRHVRHTVSYVDFQDGASQLQFCSDKCLNQYKMHIFCRETRAHLELHPHIHREESTSGTLITPDLWLRNCKSPELQSLSPQNSPKIQENRQDQTSPLPLITVAHPSKLLSSTQENKRNRIKVQKKNRKKCPSTITTHLNHSLKVLNEDSPQDLRVRHTPTNFENVRSNSEDSGLKPPQDDVSPQYNKVPQKDKTVINILNNPYMPPQEPRLATPRHFNPVQAPQTAQTPLKKILESVLPPPTVFVPYPIILPLPIPIPIPIPIPNIIKKDTVTVKEMDKKDVASQTEELKENKEKTKNVEENDKIDGVESSQNEILDVVGIDAKEDEEKLSSKRPLRKRNKVVENSKVFAKTRKLISTSSH